jgi:tetratricopeptide (TPR) repeat protein
MSAKQSSALDPLDLALRDRASPLGAEEALALERALATSAALRIAHEVGHDLDYACRVRARDQALIDRALDRALAPSAEPGARRATRVASILAATLVVASAAAATHVVVVQRLAPATAMPTGMPSGRPAAKKPLGVARPAAAPSLERGAAPSPSGVAVPSWPLVAPPPPPVRAGAAPVTSSEPAAASLFREAGAARRAGDVAKARALYLELASRFPTSNEAIVSHVSLGNLLLNAGEAGAAEKAFGRYLRSGQHSLREEALAGLADALLTMGRIEEERRAREELLRLDPGGVYASRARRRIAEIDEARRHSSP